VKRIRFAGGAMTVPLALAISAGAPVCRSAAFSCFAVGPPTSGSVRAVRAEQLEADGSSRSSTATPLRSVRRPRAA
jgi:hypothetical protein